MSVFRNGGISRRGSPRGNIALQDFPESDNEYKQGARTPGVTHGGCRCQLYRSKPYLLWSSLVGPSIWGRPPGTGHDLGCVTLQNSGMKRKESLVTGACAGSAKAEGRGARRSGEVTLQDQGWGSMKAGTSDCRTSRIRMMAVLTSCVARRSLQ